MGESSARLTRSRPDLSGSEERSVTSKYCVYVCVVSCREAVIYSDGRAGDGAATTAAMAVAPAAATTMASNGASII